MFSIRQLFTSLSILYVVILFSGMLLSRWLWFYPNELQLHLERQQHEIKSLSSLLTIVQQQLLEHTDDYATRQKTLDLMQLNASLSRQNIKDAFDLKTLNVNVMVLLDASRQPILAQQYEQNTAVDIRTEPRFQQWLQALQQQDAMFDGKSHTDSAYLEHLAYLLAASPIHTKDSSTPLGWIIFLQEMDDSLWKILGQITQLKITPSPELHTDPSFDLKRPLNIARTVHQRCLFDNSGHPTVCLELSHNTNKIPQFFDVGGLVLLMGFILVPIVLFAFFINQTMHPIHKAIHLFKRFDEQGEIQPINFEYWIPIKELREFKNSYNTLVAMALEQRQQLELLSNTDTLTEIPNRRAFDTHFASLWNRLKRHRQSVALVIVDIDFFKNYNDFYGHPQGDSALKLVARALASCARRADEIAARVGGEEFALMLYVDNEQELNGFKQRLFQAIDALKISHQKSETGTTLTVSAGIAWLKDSGSWLENYLASDWLETADIALYKAKRQGRNRAEVITINASHPFAPSEEDLPA